MLLNACAKAKKIKEKQCYRFWSNMFYEAKILFKIMKKTVCLTKVKQFYTAMGFIFTFRDD